LRATTKPLAAQKRRIHGSNRVKTAGPTIQTNPWSKEHRQLIREGLLAEVPNWD